MWYFITGGLLMLVGVILGATIMSAAYSSIERRDDEFS